MFASAIGTPLDAANVRREFRKITEAAGLGAEWAPRDLRPTDLRVAVWVAVHHGAAPSREDRPRTLVQPEPIRTAATRAATAAYRTARKYSNVPAQPPVATTSSTLS